MQWKCGEIRFEVGSRSQGIAAFGMCFCWRSTYEKIASKFKVLLIKRKPHVNEIPMHYLFLILGRGNIRYFAGRRVGRGNRSQTEFSVYIYRSEIDNLIFTFIVKQKRFECLYLPGSQWCKKPYICRSTNQNAHIFLFYSMVF